MRAVHLTEVAVSNSITVLTLLPIKTLAQERGCEVIGLALNKVREETLEMSVIAVLPEDDEVKESFNEGVPITVKDESREFSREIADLAKFLLRHLMRAQ